MLTTTVNNIPNAAQFVCNSQDCLAVRESLGRITDGYDAFFVIVEEGDYCAVWGICGAVPYLSKLATRLI